MPWIDLLSLFRFALKYVTTATVNRTTPVIMTVMAIPRTTIVPTEQNKHMTAIATLHVRITIVHAEQNQHRSLDRDATSLNTFTFKHAQMKKIFTVEGGALVFFFDSFIEYSVEPLLNLRMYMIIKIKLNTITCTL